MKFSFINASPDADLHKKGNGIASFPPLGILYLATILKEKGIEVSVLDQAAKVFTLGKQLSG